MRDKQLVAMLYWMWVAVLVLGALAVVAVVVM